MPSNSSQVPLGNLKPDPKNARKRTPQSKFLIGESLKKFGAARSIVIDEDNRVLAGNGTIEGAKQAGIQNVRVIETDGDEIIAVKRKGLSEEEKVGLALADNRTADLSEWDGAMLEQLSQEHDIGPWFSEDDITEILGEKEDLDEDLSADQSLKLTGTYQILVDCVDEVEQTATLETLLKEGLKCRALNS